MRTWGVKGQARLERRGRCRIAKAGRPLAELVPLGAAPRRRVPGGWEGKVRVAEDFDAPLPEAILDAFEGKA